MVEGVRNLSKSIDVLGFQEFGPSDKRAALKKLVVNCKACGYALYMPELKNGGNVPIVWKKAKFKLLSTGNTSVPDGSTFGKRFTWVRLQDRKTGHDFYHFNLHLTPGYSKGGRPHPDRPALVRDYNNHMATIVKKVTSFKEQGTVFLSGDFNINHNIDAKVRHNTFPYRKLGSIGIYSNWTYLGTTTKPTHGTAYLDYVFMNKNSKATPKSHRAFGKYTSDHRPVGLTVELRN